MIIVNKYTCPKYLKVTYSIHILKRNKLDKSFNKLNEQTFYNTLELIKGNEKTVLLNNVSQSKDLDFNLVNIEQL